MPPEVPHVPKSSQSEGEFNRTGKDLCHDVY